ncbi:hypothetical protein SAY87_026424 [Trapa incisa]|uniref:MADS-box domain-containing protein n=1 Tax=Trapa incisa TaxID=236973 RepID=A0AAN7JM09_9MYRT|nr:hypothetical protein SAY87_026424 [Trapa incisa]
MAPISPTPSKPSLGRRRIAIRRRENIEERRVTFTKRRTGLFEKAAEICLMCDAKIAILTFSEGGKDFCFGNPDIDYILDCYLMGRSPAEICLPGGCGCGEYDHTLGESKQLYQVALRGLERDKGEGKTTAAAHMVAGQDGGFWWDRSVVDDLSLEELSSTMTPSRR